MSIIAFTGKMGSGKSTAIECVRQLSRQEVRLQKFAAPLYDMQEFIYRRIEPAYKKPEGFIKDRKLLQWLGTEWGRQSVSDNLWVSLWVKEALSTLYKENGIIVCDDCRFDNEAEAVKSVGGYVIKIESNKNEPEGGRGIAGHASESGVDLKHVDYIIENNGTIDDLRTSLLTMNSKLALW